MRNLVIPPLILLLTSCATSNIRVKTDIGTKYIVPYKTIKVQDWTNEDAHFALEDKKPKGYRIHSFKSAKIKNIHYFDCPWGYKFGEKFCGYTALHIPRGQEEDFIKFKIIQENQNYLRSRDIKTHAKLITYRTIFVDLNNQKSAMQERKVACLNYRRTAKLNWEKSHFLIYWGALIQSNKSLKDFEPIYNNEESPKLAAKKKPIYNYDIMNQKICKRFGMY